MNLMLLVPKIGLSRVVARSFAAAPAGPAGGAVAQPTDVTHGGLKVFGNGERLMDRIMIVCLPISTTISIITLIALSSVDSGIRPRSCWRWDLIRLLLISRLPVSVDVEELLSPPA